MSGTSQHGGAEADTAPPLHHRLAVVSVVAREVLGRAVRGARRAGRARLGFGAVLVVALPILTWPVTSVTPSAGLDNSWQAGLSLALARGVVFGRQIVFTYGPLGLVTEPRAGTGGTLLLGLLGAAAMQLALVAVVLRSLRRRFSWPVAALITLLGVSIIVSVSSGLPPLDEIAFGLVAIALAQPPARSRQAARALALAGGVLAGLALLVKFNDGLGVATIVAVGLLGGVSR